MEKKNEEYQKYPRNRERTRRIIKVRLSNILYKRTTVGKNGEKITVYKFRTYKKGARKLLTWGKIPLGKILDKTKFNEIPQIINLIKGDIQFFGYRPLELYEYEELPKNLQEGLKNYKPGIFPLVALANFHIDHKDKEGRKKLISLYLKDMEEKGYFKTNMNYIKAIFSHIFKGTKKYHPDIISSKTISPAPLTDP